MLQCTDIVMVPFPFTDKTQRKKRPVVILSDAHYSQKTGHIITCMITTAKKSSWPHDVMIQNWEEAGLNAPCVIRFKISTIATSQIIKHIGQLTHEDAKALKSVLQSSVMKDICS